MEKATTKVYDIAIIGLGPSGAILARMLSKKYKIIAIDKKDSVEKGFQKPCGGLLSPDAQKALARLDICLPKDVMVDPQIFSVKTIDLKNDIIRHYQRFYINLDRHKFDLWLKSLIPSHVEVHSNSHCSAVEKIPDGYRITFHENGMEQVIIAKYIVGADGANSLVRHTLYPKRKIRTYTSIQEWFLETHPNPFYSCIFDFENTDCYSWSISKNNQFIFGGAFPIDNSRKRFENQKKKLEKIGFKFGKPIKTEACMVLRPSSFYDFCCGKNNAFLIGEAAGFISPSSLEGISSAINSAQILSEVLNANSKNANREYRLKTFNIRLKISLKLLKCPFMYNSFLRKLVLKSRLKSIDIAVTKR
ncbi:MAG TPA: FAD-binding protein [Clostridiales bacterium]|nr:FAD-binding protein [Clostridiales bacterium]